MPHTGRYALLGRQDSLGLRLRETRAKEAGGLPVRLRVQGNWGGRKMAARAPGEGGLVPFAFYRRLTRGQQRIYRQSDEVAAVRLPGAEDLRPLVDALAVALENGDRAATQAAADRLLARMTAALRVAPLRAEVQTVRPSRHWGELHGLYTPGGNGRLAQVTVWMRTAQRHQVVKFRTFLRTLLHELGHHLDYEMLGLPDSFHTEGFYKRESSLLRQLLGADTEGAAS